MQLEEHGEHVPVVVIQNPDGQLLLLEVILLSEHLPGIELGEKPGAQVSQMFADVEQVVQLESQRRHCPPFE